MKPGGGQTYDADGNQVGTYDVDEQGNLTLTFFDSMLKNAAVIGKVTIDMKFTETTTATGGSVEKKVGDASVVVYAHDSDMTVDKKTAGTPVDNGDGTTTLYWQVDVTSQYGTFGDYVYLTDELLAGTGLTVTSVTKDGASVNYSLTTNEDAKKTLQLPSMSAGDKYVVTLTSTVPSSYQGNITNKVGGTFEGPTDDNKHSNNDEETQIINKAPDITKTFLKEENGKFVWQITVNSNGANLSGHTLSDKISSGNNVGDVDLSTATISPNYGYTITNGVITFQDVNGAANTQTYTITVATDPGLPASSSL